MRLVTFWINILTKTIDNGQINKKQLTINECNLYLGIVKGMIYYEVVTRT